MQFNKLVESLSFIKHYSPKKPPIEFITKAIETANALPSPGNLQPIQYVIVEDKEKIAELAQACQQAFITKAPYVIVITSNLTQLKRLYDDKAETYLNNAVGSSALAIYLELLNQGLSGAWVAPFSIETIQNSIAVPEGQNIDLLITAGYPLTGARPVRKRKAALINKVFFDSFGNKFYKSPSEVTRKDV